MGSGWSRGERQEGGGGGVASSELYVDKVVKFLAGLVQLALAIALVIVTHVASQQCDGYIVFSFLLLFQSLSLLFLLLLWYWCCGQDLANHVQEIIHHANHLTNQYKRYADGVNRGRVHREVTEVTLHSDLDNYLEHLLHVLTVKGQRLYVRHLLKWVSVLVVSVLWLVGLIVVMVQCRGLPTQLYMQVLLILPLLILAGTVAVVVFHLLYDLCPARSYQATFFYQAVPGAMDARLTQVVSEMYNPRYVWLLSRHCWQNAAALCDNPGLSKSLARKYCYMSHLHRADRWRDQHFPTLRSEQRRFSGVDPMPLIPAPPHATSLKFIQWKSKGQEPMGARTVESTVERFQFSSEQYVQNQGLSDAGCGHALLWCCLDTPTPHHPHYPHHNTGKRMGGWKKWNPRKQSRKQKVGTEDDAGNTSSGYSSGIRPTFQAKAEDGYMTPNLFVRKLVKESATPEQLLDEEIALKQKKKEQRAPHARPSPRDDLHVASLGPQRFPSHATRGQQLPLSRDDTEVDYGAFYQPHESDPHRMQREYDPLTYGVRMSVKKEMAKDLKVWRS